MEGMMNGDKVLITGGLGFIGCQVAEQLVCMGRAVRLLDNLNPQIHGAVPHIKSALLHNPRAEVIRGDVNHPEGWRDWLEGVSCVIHLAAETGTAQSMYEIRRYTGTNVGGTACLLDYLASHKHRVAKIILASSRSVYGEGAYLCDCCGLVYPPMREDAAFRSAQWEPLCPTCNGQIHATATRECAKTAPASIYAATKLAQEDLVRVASKALGIPAVIFRLQNVYGEGQSLKNPYTGILSIFSNQLRQGKTISLYEDGRESRDFVHVTDVARAVVLGLASDKAEGSTLNVGSGQPTSVERVALLLKELLGGKTPPIVSGEYRLGDIRHGYADLTAIRAQLGFLPEVTLEQGLDRFVAWLGTQPVEPDRLDLATQELLERGLMARNDAAKAATV
jgi:dTDP-L-rhamnose 4-epimerase